MRRAIVSLAVLLSGCVAERPPRGAGPGAGPFLGTVDTVGLCRLAADGWQTLPAAERVYPVLAAREAAPGKDLVTSSAVNFYEKGVTQAEVESLHSKDSPEPPRFVLNSTVVRRGGKPAEDVWKVGGRYGDRLSEASRWL